MLAGAVVPLALLAAVLAWAIIRPAGWPEAIVAVPAAVVALGVGAISPSEAGNEVMHLGPVIGFLAAVLVLAQMCADDGLFAWCGAWMAHVARGRPDRLLVAVFVAASLVTAVFSLDATVVLLTPVVFATAAGLTVRARPHVYACTHLSNTGSLLLPVSNLTNLLAFHTSGLSFVRFASLMAAPWLVAIAIEFIVFRWFFAADLVPAAAVPEVSERIDAPWFAIAAVAATLAGFAAASAAGANPAWAAAASALLLAIRAALRRRTTMAAIVRAADLPFLLFVPALAVVVRAVIDNGLDTALGGWLPHSDSLAGMIGIATVAALAANLVNNLPAVLVLLPLTAAGGPAAVLAVLIGVNIGPNLTYAGSLATMLWRGVLQRHNHPAKLGEFTALGLLTVPAALVGAVVALWASLRLLGG